MGKYEVVFLDRQNQPHHLRVEAQEQMFSPRALDLGTKVMLALVEREHLLHEGDEVLDLGCGTGVVGMWATLQKAKVTCVDSDPVAVQQAQVNFKQNALPEPRFFCSDGLHFWCEASELGEGQPAFNLILSNPPYHTDYAVAKHFIEDGFKALHLNGKIVLVVKRPLWYQNKLKSIFGGCKIWEEDGYAVLIAEKRGFQPAFIAQKRAKKEKVEAEREQQRRLTKKKKSRFSHRR